MAEGLGSVIGGGIGLGVTALTGIPPNITVPAGAGLGGLIEGGIKKRQSDKAAPPLVDPLQAQLLQDLKRRQRAVQAGTDTLTQFNKSLISQQAAASRSAVMSAAGGNTAATIAALARINRGAGRNVSELLASQSQRDLQMQQLIGQTTNLISGRKLDLQRAAQMQKLAESTQATKDALGNIAGATARISPEQIQSLLGGAATSTPIAAVPSEAVEPAVSSFNFQPRRDVNLSTFDDPSGFSRFRQPSGLNLVDGI